MSIFTLIPSSLPNGKIQREHQGPSIPSDANLIFLEFSTHWYHSIWRLKVAPVDWDMVQCLCFFSFFGKNLIDFSYLLLARILLKRGV